MHLRGWATHYRKWVCQAVGVLSVLRSMGQGKGTSLVMSGHGGMQIFPGQYMGGGLCRTPGALRGMNAHSSC